jgi:hypothetical protein
MWPHSWPVPIVCLVFVDATIILLTSLVCSLVFSIDSCSSVFFTFADICEFNTFFWFLLLHYWLVLHCCSVIILLQCFRYDGIYFISIIMNWKFDFLSIRWFPVFCIMMLAYVVLWYVLNIKFKSPKNMSKSRTRRFLLCSTTVLYSCALCCDCSDTVLWLSFLSLNSDVNNI